MAGNNKMLGVLLSVLIAVHTATAANYIYEWGTSGSGSEIYTTKGDIYVDHHTEVEIPVPANMAITYARITVYSLNPPKVNYNNGNHIVTIDYSLLEIPTSTYEIYAEGVHVATDGER